MHHSLLKVKHMNHNHNASIKTPSKCCLEPHLTHRNNQPTVSASNSRTILYMAERLLLLQNADITPSDFVVVETCYGAAL